MMMEGYESLSLEENVRAVQWSVKQKKINNKDKVKIKKMGHYRSDHSILLVGEGDFSFSACLAQAFGYAPNIVATSLNSRVRLESKYSKVAANLKELEDRGCTILHGVDAHTMFNHRGLVGRSFDCIVFNFPHAGFYYNENDDKQIRIHQKLVRGFLKSAKMLLSANGRVHITHKTAYPFSKWDVVGLAEKAGMRLFAEHDFVKWLYPGYHNKRGDGYRCDRTFPIGCCSTFMFVAKHDNK